MAPLLIDYANQTAEVWAAWFATVMLDTAALLAIVALLWWAIRRRVSPQVGCWLFLLIPLKVLLPLQLSVPPEIARWAPSAQAAALFDATTPAAKTADTREVAVPPGSGPVAFPPTPNGAFEPEKRETPQSVDGNKPAELVADVPPTASMPATQTPELHATNSAAGGTRLSFRAWIMIVWMGIVAWLATRLASTQFRFGKQLRHAARVREDQIGIDLHELCRRAGVKREIRFVQSAELSAPAVWGLLQPTIILPNGIASSLTTQQLRWVLLHELAHIRRRDLPIIALQRCAAILYFVNPAIWIANRVAHNLREYACDDLAVEYSENSPLESGEAFMQVLRFSSETQRELSGALGFLGTDVRATCTNRVQRLLDTDRRISTRLGAGTVCGLLLSAAVLLPSLRAADASNDATAGKSNPQEPATGSRTLELLVVGPDGKPVPDARVQIRTRPAPKPDQFKLGEVVLRGTYGTYATTAADGRLVVEYPTDLKSFRVSIVTAGYAPFWAEWNTNRNSEAIPEQLTARLEAGWSIGGIVVDGDGNPVADAKVEPRINYNMRPGDDRQLYIGDKPTTDAQGRWSFHSVPASQDEVVVVIDHPRSAPSPNPLLRSKYEVTPGRQPAAKITLPEGLTVTGHVTDEEGTPIAGALIRTEFTDRRRRSKQVTTDKHGAYDLRGCPQRTLRIVASAKGRALEMHEVAIKADMPPVDFEMKPGGHLRIRVLDLNGDPLPKARVFFQRWRGPVDYFEFDHLPRAADENGVWEWNESPLDPLQADIGHRDHMGLSYQPVQARDEEYVFRLPPPLIVSGTVVDAQTKKPIENFRVVPGVRSTETHMNWARGESFAASDGKYEFRRRRSYFAHLLQIEAHGYLPAVSRDIKSNEGSVTIDFELEKGGTDVATRVATSAGKPAAGAKIALGVAESTIDVRNGRMDRGGSFAMTVADAAGRFSFPPQETPYQLVITHPEGFAQVAATPDSPPETITLRPWARVEGILRAGETPVASADVRIEIRHGLYAQDAPSVFLEHKVTTDSNGHFIFERVVPGSGSIGRNILFISGEAAKEVASSCMLHAEFPPGVTTRMDLGESGRPVIGKLRLPAGVPEEVRWGFALVEAQIDLARLELPKPPPVIDADPQQRKAWWIAWEQSPDGKAWRELSDEYQRIRRESPYAFATVDGDGTFRIDDIPPGEYSLSVSFRRHHGNRLWGHRFVVPPTDGEDDRKPVDLGTLTLQ